MTKKSFIVTLEYAGLTTLQLQHGLYRLLENSNDDWWSEFVSFFDIAAIPKDKDSGSAHE